MMSSSTSSTNSTMSTTSTSSSRLSGLLSGMDTDAIVSAMTSDIQQKIAQAQQNKQTTLWKQELYRDITMALQEFQDTYFTSTSSTGSILNESFFNVSSIVNSSSAVSVSGSTSAIKNMLITGISQLAVQAGMTTKDYTVSTQALTSGTIKESWTDNTIKGDSLTLHYNNKDYTISLDYDLVYDTDDDIQVVLDSLNKSLNSNKELSGKFSFTCSDNVISLTSTDPATDFMIKEGSKELLDGLGLKMGQAAESGNLSGTLNTANFFKDTLAAKSALEFQIGSNTYSLEIASKVTLSKDKPEQFVDTLQQALTQAIASNSDLKDKLTATVDSAGQVSFSCTQGPLSVTGGDQNLLQGLGLVNQDGTYKTSGTANRDALVKSYLCDTLAGSTMTVKLNGISKNITFDESNKQEYADAAGLKNYVQQKLNSLYGDNMVNVVENNGALSFTTTDKTSIFMVASSDAMGVLGKAGALHLYAGDTNRINTKKTLEDLESSLSTLLIPQTDDETYGMTINGKAFVFDKKTSIDTIIATINADVDAGVNIFYSSVTDTFSLKAITGGSHSKVEVSDLGGSNLATALFGSEDKRQIEIGQDAIMTMSFDGNPAHAITITRAENSFSLDGVNFTLNSTTDNSVSADAPIKFTVNNDTDSLYKKVSDFIEAYNGIAKAISSLVRESKPTDGPYKPLTDEQKKEMTETQIENWNKKAKQGLMKGDSLLNSLQRDFRTAMTGFVASTKTALSGIGIKVKEYGTDGTLVIDEGQLKSVIAENQDKIISLFTSEDGIASRLKDVLKTYTDSTDGRLITKAGVTTSTKVDQSSLTKMIKSYEDTIDDLQDKLTDRENYYYSQFTQLEMYLSKMNSYASWFTSSAQ